MNYNPQYITSHAKIGDQVCIYRTIRKSGKTAYTGAFGVKGVSYDTVRDIVDHYVVMESGRRFSKNTGREVKSDVCRSPDRHVKVQLADYIRAKVDQ